MPDWKSIGHLARKGHCPKLRKLNVTIYSHDVQQDVKSIGQQDLSKEFGAFSEHLAVHLLGFPLNPQQQSAMVKFFKPFGRKIEVSKGRFHLQLDQKIYNHIKKWEKKFGNLAQFYRMVDSLVLNGGHQLASDWEFFKRFSQCPEMVYTHNPSPSHLDGHLDALINLKIVFLLGVIDHPLNGQKLLNAIGEKCHQLEDLVFNSCEQIDFGFLFKLQRLRVLNLHLAFTPSQHKLIDLLKKHRDLSNLDICFIMQMNIESKTELSNFKKQVNETFSERFEARRREFHARIYTKNGHQFVRYVMKIDHQPIEMPEEEEVRMFALVQYKKDKLGKKAFQALLGQPTATGDKR